MCHLSPWVPDLDVMDMDVRLCVCCILDAGLEKKIMFFTKKRFFSIE